MAPCPSGVPTAPLSLVSSANLWRVHYIPLSRSIDHYPLAVTIQLIPDPLNCSPIKSIPLQFRDKDVEGDNFDNVLRWTTGKKKK